VRKPASEAQVAAWLVLVKFLQERYGIPVERVYAHNWIDYKDHRYCEGCDLAQRARALVMFRARAFRKPRPVLTHRSCQAAVEALRARPLPQKPQTSPHEWR